MEPKNINSILFMLKFSERNKEAFAIAFTIAQNCNSKLHVLHIVNKDIVEKDLEEMDTLINEIRQTFETDYKSLLTDYPYYSLYIRPGDPTIATIQTAKHIKADLIVIGGHSEGKSPSFNRLGVIGTSIIQYSFCTVLIIP